MRTKTIIFPRPDTQYDVLVEWLDYTQMSLRNSQMFRGYVNCSFECSCKITLYPNAMNRRRTYRLDSRSVKECRFVESSRTEMYLSFKTNWNYNSPLSWMCLFYWQRIHFIHQLFNNQVVFIAQRITVSSNLNQSHRAEITCDDPWFTIDVIKWSALENPCAVIGWLQDPRGYWLFCSNRKEIWSPTRLHIHIW